MNYLISSYSVNPYLGSEDGVGWNWVKQYEKHYQKGDRIILLTKHFNKRDVQKGFVEFGINHVELVIVDVPDCLNWFREKYSVFHHMYYILWQHWAWAWVKKSGIKFDVIHHVTMGDYRITGEMYKARHTRTIFGPVGGAQVTPPELERYEKNSWTLYLRKFVNRSCDFNPFYKRAIQKFTEVYPSNQETFCQINLLRGGRNTKQIVELGITEEFQNLDIKGTKKNNRIKILYVGRLIEKKGVVFLIEVARRLQKEINFVLDIYGTGTLENTLINLIHKYRLEDNVIIHGEVKHGDISEKYKFADIFVFPSLRETGGTVLVEAMAYGLPIVGFDMSFCSQLNMERCGLFIDVNQKLDKIQKDFCEAIKELCIDAGLRNQLGQNGYRFVNEQLGWERKYEMIINKKY